MVHVDCLSFPIQSVEKLERAPQKISRASRAPFPYVDVLIIHVEPTPSSPKSPVTRYEILTERQHVCLCLCAWGRGGGGAAVCVFAPPVTDKHLATAGGGGGGGGGGGWGGGRPAA